MHTGRGSCSRMYVLAALLFLGVLMTACRSPVEDDQKATERAAATQLAGIAEKWAQGQKLNAIHLYEVLVSSHPDVDLGGLAEMYALVYKDKKREEPASARLYRTKAVGILEKYVSQSPSNSLRLCHSAQLHDEYLDSPETALDLYEKSLPLLVRDMEAIRAGGYTAAGYGVAPKGRPNVLLGYERAIAHARERILILRKNEQVTQ